MGVTQARGQMADASPSPSDQFPSLVRIKAPAFGLLAVYLLFLYSYRLPQVHFFMDSSGVRDMGTLLTHLTSDRSSPFHWAVMIFAHMEGPLQWIFLNLWEHALGDLLPLNPATVYFPQTIFGFLAALFCHRLGAALGSARLGWLCALLLVLNPWMAISLRRASLFMTMGVALESATLYYFLRHMQEPRRPAFRLAAPLALTLYFMVGLDWPSFLFVLVLFVLAGGRGGEVARNPFLLIPLGYFLAVAALTAVFYSKDMAWHTTMVAYPWYKFFLKSGQGGSDFWRVVADINKSLGPAFWLALGGLALSALKLWQEGRPLLRAGAQWPQRGRQALWLACLLWLAIFAPPFLLSGVSEVTYAYLLGLPVALLGGRLLDRGKIWWLAPLFIFLLFWQWSAVLGDRNFVRGEDDRRVLAMAAYLNEKRPDLLKSQSTVALLPRNHTGMDAACVGQYARGAFRQLVMVRNYPATRSGGRIGSAIADQAAFVDQYNRTGQIRVQWLILASEDLDPAGGNQAAEFYQRLFNDPQVSWSACLKDNSGRGMWLGEVKQPATPAEKAPVQEVAPWADLYTQRYDRISFLKKNPRFIFHY